MVGGGGSREQEVLGEHVEAAGAWGVAIELVGGDAFHGGLAFQDFEAVGGDQDGLGGFVHAVVASADALQEARGAFGGADLDDLIHAAPVYAQIERGGGDDGAQRAVGHGGFDAQALGEIEAAVVQGDGQGGLVEAPEFLEEQLGLGAGVDEDDRHAGFGDALEDDAGGGQAHAAGPGDAVLGQHHAECGRGAWGDGDGARLGAGGDVGLQGGRVGDGGREAGAAGLRGQGGEAGEAEGELVAAFGAGERVDLVDDDVLEVGEEGGGLAEEDGEGFRGGEQNVRRGFALGAAAGGGGVAGSGVDGDGQRHFGDRRGEVAGDVCGEGFEGGDVEGVQGGGLPGVGEGDEGGEEAGEGFAAAGGGDEEDVFAGVGGLQQGELVGAGGPGAGGEPGGEGVLVMFRAWREVRLAGGTSGRWVLRVRAGLNSVGEGKASSPFLKKRTKKLLLCSLVSALWLIIKHPFSGLGRDSGVKSLLLLFFRKEGLFFLRDRKALAPS